MKQEFTKKDLRSGMLVENRKGETGMVMLNTESGGDAIVSNSESIKKIWGDLSEWDDLLRKKSKSNSNRDIVKVFGMSALSNNRCRASFSIDSRKLLWERLDKTPEYTLEEIAEKLGHDFKIKKSKS